MASTGSNVWHQALAEVQGELGAPGRTDHGSRGAASGAGLPAWLPEANLVEKPSGGRASGHTSRYQVRLPESVRPDDLSAVLRSALQRALERTMGRRIELEFVMSERSGPPAAAGREAPPPEPSPAPAAEGRDARPAPSWPVRFTAQNQPRLNPQYTFENFVTGPCNRMAHAASLAVSDLPGGAYNPLFIHSSVGLGKSHLIQAICHKIRASRPDVSMLYVSCEDFVNQFITAIESGQIEEFRYRFRYLDMLVIDDIHFLADKDRTQEEFFHTFNTLYQSQKQVVLSSDSPPHEIPRLEERLVSRFKWGLVVRIDRPSFETRVAIVQKKARLRGVDLPEDVLKYIATVVDTNNRELEGAVVRILGYASLCSRYVDMDLAKEALRDLATAPSRMISIQDITDAVLQRYNARLSDLQSKRRSQSVAMPRQVCMYLARRVTSRSLEEIGAFFGGRDHTTVLHAERKILQLVGHDPAFRGLLEAIEQEILRA
jgi:chromosomal replication initiator protein